MKFRFSYKGRTWEVQTDLCDPTDGRPIGSNCTNVNDPKQEFLICGLGPAATTKDITQGAKLRIDSYDNEGWQ